MFTDCFFSRRTGWVKTSELVAPLDDRTGRDSQEINEEVGAYFKLMRRGYMFSHMYPWMASVIGYLYVNPSATRHAKGLNCYKHN